MTSEDLEKALKKFYGEDNYIPRAAQELRVDLATVCRWLDGRKIPGPVEAWAREKKSNRRARIG
jgi:hypothetical protein